MDIFAKLLGEWSTEFNGYSCALKLCLSVIIGMVMGIDRARNLQAAGLKTYVFGIIAVSICGMLDFYLINNSGVSFPFASASIIIGTAIISSNTILFNSKNQFKGLTTSVGLLCGEAISLSLAFGFYFIGILAFAIYVLGFIFLPKMEAYVKMKSKSFDIHVELKNREGLQTFIVTLRKLGLKVNDVEINPAYANSGMAVYSFSLKIESKELKKSDHKEIIDAISQMEIVSYIEQII